MVFFTTLVFLMALEITRLDDSNLVPAYFILHLFLTDPKERSLCDLHLTQTPHSCTPFISFLRLKSLMLVHNPRLNWHLYTLQARMKPFHSSKNLFFSSGVSSHKKLQTCGSNVLLCSSFNKTKTNLLCYYLPTDDDMLVFNIQPITLRFGLLSVLFSNRALKFEFNSKLGWLCPQTLAYFTVDNLLVGLDTFSTPGAFIVSSANQVKQQNTKQKQPF